MANPLQTHLPDLARLVRLRLANPQPGEPPSWVANTIGRGVLRQLHDDHSGVVHSAPFRGSALGKCLRAQAHRYHGTEAQGRTLGAKARARFALGDSAEQLLLYALRDAMRLCRSSVVAPSAPFHGTPCGWLPEDASDSDRALCSRVADWRWTGSGVSGQLWLGAGAPVPVTLDAMVRSDEHITYPVEIKSLSSYAITSAQKALRAGLEPWDDSEGYAWQLNAYLRATSSPFGYVLAICGDSGVVVGWWQAFDRQRHQLAVANTQQIVDSDNPTDVPQCLPDGTPLEPKPKKVNRREHLVLPWQCVYCSYHRLCWPQAREVVSRDWRGRPSTVLVVDDRPEPQPDPTALPLPGGEE